MDYSNLQKIFTEYRQPFALTYLWISLMVVFLPISMLRDYICKLLDRKLFKDIYGNNIMSSSLAMLDISLEGSGQQDDVEGALNSYLLADMSADETEGGRPLLLKDEEDGHYATKEKHELGLWEIMGCSLYLAPIWFITEVVFLTVTNAIALGFRLNLMSVLFQIIAVFIKLSSGLYQCCKHDCLDFNFRALYTLLWSTNRTGHCKCSKNHSCSNQYGWCCNDYRGYNLGVGRDS